MRFYVLHTFLQASSVFIPIVPVIALLQFILLKMDGARHFKATGPHLLVAHLFCFVLLSIFSATAIPNITNFGVDVKLSLAPFSGLFTNTAQYLQNILLFMPLGFLLPLLWKKFESKTATFLWGAALSLCIEILQMFSIRITDIDDLLMNTAGTIAGYFLFRLLRHMVPATSVFSIDGGGYWKWEPYLFLALTGTAMFFLQPFISRWIWGFP